MKEYVRRVKQTVEASWVEGGEGEDDDEEEDAEEEAAEEGQAEGGAPMEDIETTGSAGRPQGGMDVEVAGADGRG